jgi:DNA-binding NarL/FixJ family response regulator
MRVEPGTALRRARRRRQAADALSHAAARFAAIGAGAWALRAAAEASAAHSGRAPDVRLTPSEERIAALVREGSTNSQIAERLQTTRAAVEAHLTRMYGKLGIRSRVRLAALKTSR